MQVSGFSGNTHGDCDRLPAEEIARILAAMDMIEPFEMIDIERAAWEAERQSRKELDKAEFAERVERLRRMWP